MRADSRLVLRDCALWDGRTDDVRRGVDILLHDGIVHDVLPAGQHRADDAVELDMAGRFVMPGLVDMHVHLVWSGGADPAATVAAEGQHLTAMRAAANAVTELGAGITTVRDLGSNWDLAITLAEAIELGKLDGPSIVASGQTIIMTGGHDPFWGLASDGVDAVVRSVRRQVSIGAGVIKVAATGGVYGRPNGEAIGQTELTYEELAAAAREAHRFGLRVAAHALGSEGILNAVRAGIDTIEHGTFLSEEIVAEMQQHGTALCPTLHIYRAIAERDGVPAYAQAKARTAVDAHRESFQMALEAGIPVVAGTDAGSVLTPHPALVDELMVMQKYGMSTAEALRSATSTAGAVLGHEGTVGVVAPGARGDLLVLEKNPLEDLGALREQQAVLRSGRQVTSRRGA
jgi:imidazolonepropionase-like amidohydrolase